MKKILIIIMLAAVGGGAFYGGMKYTESRVSVNAFSRGTFQNLQNLSPEQQAEMRQQFEANAGSVFRGGQIGGRPAGQFINGQIIAQDDQSITVELPDGGSRIIFFSESTDMTKSVSGSIDDLSQGQQVVVSGQENSDGSYTAATIQIRP